MDKHPDAELIEALGGPAQVARLLDLGRFGTQRVYQWTKRGIPDSIKLDYPQLFLPGWKAPRRTKPQKQAA